MAPGALAVAEALAAAIRDGAAAGRRVVPDALGAARVAHAAGALEAPLRRRAARLRADAEDAWQAFLRVEVALAASRLAAVRAAAEALLAYPEGAAVYADASLRLGAVLLHDGRTEAGRAALRLARALAPARPITLREFSPEVVDAAAAATEAPGERREVRIATAPAGAALAIDGAAAGVAPARVALAPGPHVVVARADGRLPVARAFEVDAAGASVDLALAPDDAGDALARGAPRGLPAAAAARLLDAVARASDLDDVVLAGEAPARGGLALLVQRCRVDAGQARCTSIIELGYPAAAARTAAARDAWAAVARAPLVGPPGLLADVRLVAPAGAAAGASGGAATCRVCHRPWAWGVAGAVALAAAAWAVAASVARPAPVVVGDPGGFTGR